MRLAFALLVLCSCATSRSLRDAGDAGLRSIRAEALSARIRFLSDDLLEGRFPGTRGHAIAERYVASELQQLGLEPAGAAGSYLQPVPLRAAHDVEGSASLSIGGEALREGDEFLLSSNLRNPEVDVEGQLVFAGFAVQAPEYKYDDLEGLDLTGKIALVFRGAPLSEREDFFPPVAHAVLADMRAKLRRLAARGAVGMIGAFRPQDEEILPWSRADAGLPSRRPCLAARRLRVQRHEGTPHGDDMNAIDLLEQQHGEVEDLFEKLEEDEGDKAQLFKKLADSLAVHATIEEKVFYPLTKTARTEDVLLEAVEEHLSVKRLLADMLKADPESDAFEAKVKVLKEQVEHHVEEERSELFPKVKKLFAAAELEEMGKVMEKMAEELEAAGDPRMAVPAETGKPAPI